MTGLFGASTRGGAPEKEVLPDQPWFEDETFRTGSHGLELRHQGDRDPGGWRWWTDGRRAGAVYGAVTTPSGIDGDRDLFERLLDDPTSLLPELEGSFVAAAIDAGRDRVVLATDKLGARPCYYTAAGGLRFGTRLRPILEAQREFALDGQAVSDLVMNGHLWGDETLARGVKALPPATLLLVEGGTRTRQRYWTPDYSPASPSDRYLARLADRYREAIDRMSETVDDELGMWLSGGLDSRAMLAALADDAADLDLRTYTYDSNPADGSNLEIARRIATIESVDNEVVELTSEGFVDVLENAIDVTDGMVSWSSLVNLSSTYALPDDRPGVLVEAAGQGELLGEHVRRHWLTDPSTPVESMRLSETAVPPERASGLLSYDVDPLASFKREAARSDGSTTEERILDAHFQNHYARFVYASNAVARSQTGTRVPFAYGPLLEHVARLPTEYRMGTVPFTDGAVPYGASRPKLALSRMLDASLSEIPYERTGVAPARPYGAHVVGFLGQMGVQWLENKLGAGSSGRVGTSIGGLWYRENDHVRDVVDDLFWGAIERPLFEASAVEALRSEHLRGDADHTHAIAAITTLEQWLRLVEDSCRITYPGETDRRPERHRDETVDATIRT